MRVKKLLSGLLSGIMLMTSSGVMIPNVVMAENEAEYEETVEFDATAYDYSTATAGTTPITDIWTGWTASEGSSFIYQDWGRNSVLAPNATGILTSPGYAKDTNGYKIEFVMGKGKAFQDTAVFDADGTYSFGYCYAAYNDGFYPQDGERTFTDKNLKHIKEETGTTTGKGGAQNTTTFTNDKSVMRIEVKNHDEPLTEGESTYNNYYTVKYSIDGAGNGEFAHIATEYYDGSVNGFGGIDVGVNGNNADAAYGNLKIYSLLSEATPDVTDEPSPSPSATPEVTNEPSPSPSATPEVTDKPNPSPSVEPDDPTNEDYSAYVFAYFKRRVGGGGDDERLFLALSRDGYSFRELNNGEAVFASDTAHTSNIQYSGHFRDPQIMRGEDGKFYIAVTDLQGTGNPNSKITIYPSADLINFDEGIVVDYTKWFDNVYRAWAPQIIWCPDHDNGEGKAKGAYMIYLALALDSTLYTEMYQQFATDLSDINTYTKPEKMLETSVDSIDGDIIYDPFDKEYIMYYNGDAVATSKTIDGKYKTITDKGQSGITPNQKIEGSNMFKLNGQDKWIYCADGQSFGTGFHIYETSDFNTYTKVYPMSDTNPGGYDYDFTPRHGYVVPITESELNALMNEYGYVNLPDRFSTSPLKDLTLPYLEKGYKIAGNITLPKTLDDGTEITWTSSDEATIKTTASALDKDYGANYTEYPAGKVTRPKDADKKVTLTATVEKEGKTYTKKFVVTVKKAPQMSYKEMRDKDDKDGGVFAGYLYASFIEPPKDASGQQVYFASSDDGRNWTDLNNNRPVLTSTLGTKSTRDHYIIRSAEGDRFYIIATDLNVFEKGKTWEDYAQRGSKSLMVWESDDLVNWSKQRMVQVADENVGCAWAPEAIYDEITGEYIVYWSGEDIKDGSPTKGKKIVYYSKTRDFYSFTPQQKYVIPDANDGVTPGTSDAFIDTTMIQGSDGKFYRTTKFEGVSPTQVFLDVADYPLGTFKRVKTNLAENDFLGTEGPGWFKYNKDDADEFGAKYCLMLDGYNGPNKGVGFFPTSVEDLNNENEIQFTKLTSGFKMRTAAKHGGIIPLTKEEFERVNEAYATIPQEDLSAYINGKNKVFDAAGYYTNKTSNTLASAAGWTLPSGYSFDNDTYHYLGFSGKVEMGSGYGDGTDWTAIQFDMAANSAGDMVIRDIDGKNIIGYCYSSGSDGLYVGHGDRSFGGNKSDGVEKRFNNYIKTEIGSGCDRNDTGHLTYAQHDICTIIIKNNNGAVDSYTGDYYTVETYINNRLLSTEYYSGKVNGVGGIETTTKNNAKQYYGNLQIYAAQPKIDPVVVPDKFKLFDIDFNDETTDANIGKATANGTITFGEGADGEGKAAYFDGSTNFLSLTKEDGTPLLKGKDKIVVSMKAKIEQKTGSAWYFYTAPNGNEPNGSYRWYAGLLNNYSNIVAERFKNNNKGVPAISTSAKLGEWQNITLVIDGKTSELYIDGQLAGTAEYSYTLSEILGTADEQVAYIGKAPWGKNNGAEEYAKGYFDDITIYDFATGLNMPDLTNLKTDIDLPTATPEKDGYSLTWKSSNEDVISSTGKVNRPKKGRVNVKLTATIVFDDTAITKTYNALVTGEDYYDLKLNIKNKRDVEIQPDMYGLFFEDINYAADGGLYAEMIENRSFEQLKTKAQKGTGDYVPEPGYAWSSSGTMEYKTDGGLNNNNKTYLEFTGTSFNNKAYEGMYIENGKKYKVSFWAKSPSYTGAVNVKVGSALSGTVASSITNEWKKYEVEITASGNARKTPFTVELASSGTVDFDMISVIPSDAVMGVFRKDLAEKLKDMKPGFLRFPGGCIIEGYNLADRYQWKKSVGPVEERVQNWSRWAADQRNADFMYYNQTLGIGFYEYFELCEYLDCAPVPVLSVGIPCEYQGGKGGYGLPMYKADGKTYTDEFYEYIQDALDLIEFANSTDTSKGWGKVRADMGHEEPFNLTMIGIGNEQWTIGDNMWHERYEAFEKEIHKVYPDMKLISTSGPDPDDAAHKAFTPAWKWVREKQAQNSNFTYAVDEHYYCSPEWFLENDNRYDSYDRGTKVFAGEYASQGNTLYNAIAEAAYMTGLERNADVVYMASYAPLFARDGYTQWEPDMIWFNDAESYASPNYYVQQMYMLNNGTYTLKSDATSDGKVYQTASYDAETGDIIVKIVNPNNYEQRISLEFDDSFDITGKAEEILLSGESKTDKNSFGDEKIKSVKKTINVENGMDYALGTYSFVVLRVHTESGGFISMTDFANKDGKLSYKLTGGSDFKADDYDVYTAIYNENGTLHSVLKNQMSGNVAVDENKEYEIKVMVWEKDTMKPADGYNVIKETTMENSAYKLMSYTTTGSEYYGTHNGDCPAIIGNSLHLAVSSDGGKTYEPLNSNIGVLYAEADYTEESKNPLAGDSKMLRSPYLFKTADGKYGVITARADEKSETDSTDGKAMIYTSDDLTSFDFIGYLELDTKAVYEPKCVYENGAYTISWSNEVGGARKCVTTADFKTIGEVKASSDIYTKQSVNIADATEATNVLTISKSTYDSLKTKLNAPVNTGIKAFEDVTLAVNGTPELPKRATAMYNDGSEQDYNVEWDMSNLNTTVAGEYTVNGTVVTKDYPTDFIPNRADPCALYLNGKYYFVATRDAGGQTVLNIRVADTLDGIAAADDNELLSGTDLIWAPEIHDVNGKLMIFFALGRSWNFVQSSVMVLKDGGDPTKAEDWSAPVRIKKKDGETNLIDNGITLDMTAFEWNNKWYMAWSQRIVNDPKYGHESANIYIGEFNPSDPTKLISDTTVISRPSFGWERSKTYVDEGPFTMIHNGKLYMTVATNGTDYSYAIKLLTLKENGNPLNAEDWTIKGYPLLATAMNNSEPGPGHSSFTVDENGDPVLVYHWGRNGGGRTTSIKNVHFNTKGEPVLNILRGNQVLDKYKNVTIKVIVE